MAKNAVVFELTLKVRESDLQGLIDDTAARWSKESVRVKDLTSRQLKLLKRDLDPGQMLEEFIENSHEAQANDWMSEFIDTLKDEEDYLDVRGDGGRD